MKADLNNTSILPLGSHVRVDFIDGYNASDISQATGIVNQVMPYASIVYDKEGNIISHDPAYLVNINYNGKFASIWANTDQVNSFQEI